MKITIDSTKEAMGRHAAESAAEKLNRAIAKNGKADLILATGASQFEMLAELVQLPVEWSRVTVFHLDEYVGMSIEHPASFRKYLKERFHRKVPELSEFHYIDGERNCEEECDRLGRIIGKRQIDVACVGIGENGHLAFNDPPADFDTEEPYIVVELDEACRRQQLNEGWFESLEDVPTHAISMSIRQIMRSASIVCTVPDERKAQAVFGTVKKEISNLVPATILRTHPDCHLFLDRPAASLLDGV